MEGFKEIMKMNWEELIIRKIVDDIDREFELKIFELDDSFDQVVRSTITRYKQEMLKQKGIKE